MKPARTSRQRYETFRRAYKEGRTDELGVTAARDKLPPAPKEQRRRHLFQYLRWLRPHLPAVVVVLLLAALSAGLEMLPPLFMRFVVDHVLLAQNLASGARLNTLHLVGLVFLAVLIGARLVDSSRSYRLQQLNARVVLALRRTLYERLLYLPLQKLSDMKTGGIISRLSGDVDTTSGLLQLAVISPSLSLLRLGIALVVLFALNWRLALTALTVVPGVMLISLVAARRVRPIYRAIREDKSEVDGRVAETFGGIRVVRAFRRETWEERDYSVGHHSALRKELFAHRRELVLWGSWGLLIALVDLVIVWYGGFLQIRGSASVGDIMAFQWYTFLLLNPIWQIVNSFSELQRSLAAMDRVFEVLAMAADKPDLPDATNAPTRVREIRFAGVSFEYRAGEPVVKDFELVVPGGSVVALVGRSGAGKTTVTDLVARFHDPSRGQLLVNGTDIRRFRLHSYRELLGVVPQEVFLFDGGGVRLVHRRTRRQALGRTAATPGHRPRHPGGTGDPDPRRGDQQSRHRKRAVHPAVHAGSAQGTNQLRHRPPPFDHYPCRPHRGPGSRPNRRTRDARGVDARPGPVLPDGPPAARSDGRG
jgi:ATP-binding cassette subfamily B protein/subfamily B ATP-binding cassette protein MsbA